MKVKHATDNRNPLKSSSSSTSSNTKLERICRECRTLREYGHNAPRSSLLSWVDVVWLAIHNLCCMKGGNREFFHYKTDICEYIDKYWDTLCLNKARTQTWQKTVSSTITTNHNIFKSGPTKGYWGLVKKHISPTGERYNEQLKSENTQSDIVIPEPKTKKQTHNPKKSKKRNVSGYLVHKPKNNFEEKKNTNNSIIEQNPEEKKRVRLIIRRTSACNRVTVIVEDQICESTSKTR